MQGKGKMITLVVSSLVFVTVISHLVLCLSLWIAFSDHRLIQCFNFLLSAPVCLEITVHLFSTWITEFCDLIQSLDNGLLFYCVLCCDIWIFIFNFNMTSILLESFVVRFYFVVLCLLHVAIFFITLMIEVVVSVKVSV